VQDRVRNLNQQPVREPADYVLYWSQMNRRVPSNHALAYAVTRANELGLPLLVYEALTCTYPNANDRLHTFVLEGVPDTAEALNELGAGYVFYPRKKRSDPNDVLYRLAAKAALVVSDDYPTFIAATHNASVPGKLDCPFDAVDSSCIVPMSRFEKREWAAYTIRPKIHRQLAEYFRPLEMPKLKRRWTGPVPKFHVELTTEAIPKLVAQCEIDHSVKPSTAFRGGTKAARKRLHTFLKKKFAIYDQGRNEPSEHATSNLSPYLHFGHISSLEVGLEARDYAEKKGLSSAAYLEELIVRRELAFNFARHTPSFESLQALPDWALKTLGKHARDERDPELTAEQMETATTYDDLWNATQKELLIRGKIHGYYRMYWGKKMIEWSRTHEDALELMIRMHDVYALDGRDPATYTNILWCFGLHDRPWTERPVFGQIRYMSYDGMKRKTNIQAYIQEIRYLEQTGIDPLAMDSKEVTATMESR
jgi:deoxyribodipyrimidine photo-lyase